MLEQRGVAGRGLGRRCRLLDQHIAPENRVQKHEFSFWITYISGERDINAIVLSLLWRLHLVSLFCAGVLQYIRFFDIFLSFFSFIFGANEVIILALDLITQSHLNLIEWRRDCLGHGGIPNAR